MSRPDSRTSVLSTTSRQRTSSHPSRPPLESLVYALVPSLALPKTRAGDAEQERERKDKVKEVMEFCEEIMERCDDPFNAVDALLMPRMDRC